MVAHDLGSTGDLGRNNQRTGNKIGSAWTEGLGAVAYDCNPSTREAEAGCS